MFAALLPGLRDLRAVLVAGFVLVLFIWTTLDHRVPEEEAQTVWVCPSPESLANAGPRPGVPAECKKIETPSAHSPTQKKRSAPDPTEETFLESVERRLPEWAALSGVAGGVAMLAVVTLIAFLLGIGAALFSGQVFAITSRPREASASRVRRWFDRLPFLKLGRDELSPFQTEAEGRLRDRVEDEWRAVTDDAARKLAMKKLRERGWGSYVVTARKKSGHDDEDLDVLFQIVAAECKSGAADEPISFKRYPELYQQVDRIRADAQLRAAIAIPVGMVVVSVFVDDSSGLPLWADLGVIGFTGIAMIALCRNALGMRQKWQRIIMRAVAEGDLDPPALVTLRNVGGTATADDVDPA